MNDQMFLPFMSTKGYARLSVKEFNTLLLKEFQRKRKVLQCGPITRQWRPEAVSTTTVNRLLDWVEGELAAFARSRSIDPEDD